jgi:formate dehydrogenase major subunit
MNQGKVNGYICQGFNPVASFPNKNKVVASLSKLKFLVTIDPLNTETSTFWQNHGESNDVDPSKIQTEVFRLPSTCFAEENGSIVNSGRWLQWHWKGADAPGLPLPMVKSSPVSSCACARCMPSRVARTRNRC